MRRPESTGPPRPEIDPTVTGKELDRGIQRELTTLRAEAAEEAAKHLVMAGRLVDSDPDLAYAHASAARRFGPRVAVIREALGLAAYHAGKYAEALSELRAARRISGNDEHWPVMADCERGLGRPERALAMAAAPEVAALDRAGRVEMRIVAAGARSDMGELEAAVVTLQTADLQEKVVKEWSARLRCAYAEALAAVGRLDEARDWFARAVEVDPDGETGAGDRLVELDGVVFLTDEDLRDDSDADVEIAGPIAVDRPAAASDAERPADHSEPMQHSGEVAEDAAAELAGPVEVVQSAAPAESVVVVEAAVAAGGGDDVEAAVPQEAVQVAESSMVAPFMSATEPVPVVIPPSTVALVFAEPATPAGSGEDVDLDDDGDDDGDGDGDDDALSQESLW